MDYCDKALEDFCALFWPCNYSNRRGRCVNVKECHTKGHQNERGTIIGTGPYESDFTWETFADDWLQLLQDHLSHFHRKVAEQLAYNPNTTELLEVSSVHLNNVHIFYQRLGG